MTAEKKKSLETRGREKNPDLVKFLENMKPGQAAALYRTQVNRRLLTRDPFFQNPYSMIVLREIASTDAG